MKNFTVNLDGRTTEVFIGKVPDFGVLEIKPENSLLVTDENMIHSAAARHLQSAGVRFVVLGSGEKHKHLGSIEKIAAEAVRLGLDRNALIIGLGGGVICDMAAFTASVYMRGCRLVLVPTTLLSMVDASIGGKTGVDFLERKNLIGSFFPAEKVAVFTEFLDTLPDGEYMSGLAEVIKHGFLTGGDLLDDLENSSSQILSRDHIVMADIICRSLMVKASYIEEDFREAGVRAHLNFGHTFGHALETAAGLGRFTHGEAVAWGIGRAVAAGKAVGFTEAEYAARVEKILRSYNYDIDFNGFDHKLYMEALASDKKKKDGEIRFILQKKAGVTEIKTLEPSVIKEVLDL